MWGTNENGCLGIGYSFFHCFIVEFVGWSSHPYRFSFSFFIKFYDVLFVSAYVRSTDVAHLPERVEGPFLRHSVSEVCFSM